MIGDMWQSMIVSSLQSAGTGKKKNFLEAPSYPCAARAAQAFSSNGVRGMGDAAIHPFSISSH